MRRKLYEVTRLIRSKNAGPFWLTFDIMFADPAVYRRVRDAHTIDRGTILRLFPQDPEHIKVFECDEALAIKVSFPRTHSSGSPLDSDVFGGQQYAPLLDLVVEV